MPPSYLATVSCCFQLSEYLSGLSRQQLFKEYGHPVIDATFEYWTPNQQNLLISHTVIFAHAAVIARSYKPGTKIDHSEVKPYEYDGTLKVFLKSFLGAFLEPFYNTGIPAPAPPFGSFMGITCYSYDPEQPSAENLRYFDLTTTFYDAGSREEAPYTTYSLRIFIPLLLQWAKTRTPQPNSTLAIEGSVVGIVELGSMEAPAPDSRVAVLLEAIAFIPTTRSGGNNPQQSPSTPSTPRTPRRRGELPHPGESRGESPINIWWILRWGIKWGIKWDIKWDIGWGIWWGIWWGIG
ncbi:hypothetical protein BJ508DRAFT_335822 [Ascobolus immersus RN42]|uniref:Uncharacterized protein n=1 Tax=Ascobolus immersus RN42 TaxID=1160509 RepID=A0A3N4HH45_ASCIM|nr:hypothetical protein BJ508DRAFT_335822 [Ascobolus immersus RN42]